jgi:hypothetical protein
MIERCRQPEKAMSFGIMRGQIFADHMGRL